jgi:ERCC4-related helicase
VEAEGLKVDGRSWKFLQFPEAYSAASQRSTRPLALEPTVRQLRTAEAILCRLCGVGVPRVGGILLADDVGLGKTTVAALVAWVVAGTGGTVRVLAPNAVLRRRWEEELKAHVPLLNARATQLRAETRFIKDWDTQRLREGRIQVGTHYDLVKAAEKGQARTRCSLLIIDEAHRAKSEECAFRGALEEQGHLADAKLILTATPFSIAVDELIQLLGICGAKDVERPVRRYADAQYRLHTGGKGRDPQREAEKLEQAAREAVEAIAPYVIRHSIQDLTISERQHFGEVGPTWSVKVPSASETELELLLRMDRLLRLTRTQGRERTNDPRFHVGWSHLRHELSRVRETVATESSSSIKRQLSEVRRLLAERDVQPHPKMSALAEQVARRVEAEQEKVLVFCHHRATALELLETLDTRLRVKDADPTGPSEEVWKEVWRELLEGRAQAVPLGEGHEDIEGLRETFIGWLAGPGLRRQVLTWLPEVPKGRKRLSELLASTRVRSRTEPRVPTVSEAADNLFRTIIDPRSRSTLAVLRAARYGSGAIPGDMAKGHRVMGSWTHTNEFGKAPRTLHQGEPDIVLSIFNSPFGPEVLVATDRLSEGVDLHRCCRLLVHYELDPSPIRTLQRNGRVRRVNSWAALTRQPVEYAYPSYGGTRDARAVEVMQQRLQRFDLLLGGVPPVKLEDDAPGEQTFVSDVLGRCERLRSQNRRLRI